MAPARPTGRFAICELTGGLGNQLFQYAAARSLARREARALYFAWHLHRGNTQRSFMLDHFRLPEGVHRTPLGYRTLCSLGLRVPLTDRKAGKLWRLAMCRLHTLRESSFSYAPLASSAEGVVTEGYFQSWRYFADLEAELRETLRPWREPSERNAQLLARISRENAVCVHVRRGDYVTSKDASAYHGCLPADYYHAGIEALDTAARGATFYVFSDDSAWARQNLLLGASTTVVDHNGVDVPWEDLRLMSACRHFVIANSTLSWWAAWLGPHADKRVVAPKRWFTGARHDTKDLCPHSWTLL